MGGKEPGKSSEIDCSLKRIVHWQSSQALISFESRICHFVRDAWLQGCRTQLQGALQREGDSSEGKRKVASAEDGQQSLQKQDGLCSLLGEGRV